MRIYGIRWISLILEKMNGMMLSWTNILAIRLTAKKFSRMDAIKYPQQRNYNECKLQKQLMHSLIDTSTHLRHI